MDDVAHLQTLAIRMFILIVGIGNIIETDADLEKTAYAAVYEVEIETADAEYKYVLDASTGEILSSKVE